MELFLTYLFKSSALLAIFYAVYYFLLRKDTFFTINRHFLLVGIIISLLLPFLEFTTIKFIEEPDLYNSKSTSSILTNTVSKSINWWFYGFAFYSIGMLIFMTRFMIQLVSLKKLLRNTRTRKQGNYNLIEVNEDIAPFSFFSNIVYNSTLHTDEELDMILKHEKAHVIQNHTIDLLIINLLIIFQWINPFAWFYKKSIAQNLEFIADRHTINQITSKKEYLLTLVKVSSNNYASVANNFHQSLIKKRIVMLNKQTSQKRNLWKIFLILPLLVSFLWSFNTKEITKIKPNVAKKQFNPDTKDTIKFIINKTATQDDLDRIKKDLKDRYKVEIEFSEVTRNNSDEITGIKVNITSKKSNANYAISNANPIRSFVISYQPEKDIINIYQSNSDYLVFKNKPSDKRTEIIEIHPDQNENHEFIFVQKDRESEQDIDNQFEIRTDDSKTFAFLTGDGQKEPLIIINGKKISKNEMKKLDSKKIKNINVLKGENAINKYGKKAKNGVIEITTKKN